MVRGAAAALGARAVQIAPSYGPDVDARMVERKCRNQVVEQMWGFVKLSYALATAYEKTAGVRYDHVIRHRTDTVCRNASRLLADAGAALGLVGSTVDPQRDPVFLGNTQQGRQGRAQQDFFWIATRPVADVAMRAVDYALNDNGTCGLRDATFFFEDNHERIIRAHVPDVRVLLPPKQSFCCDKVCHQNNRKARPSSHYLVPSGFCPGGPHPSSHAMAHYSDASARKCALAFVGCPHVDYN